MNTTVSTMPNREDLAARVLAEYTQWCRENATPDPLWTAILLEGALGIRLTDAELDDRHLGGPDAVATLLRERGML